MTVLQLKRTMDRRFDRTDRSNRRRFTTMEAKIAASKAELLDAIRRSEADTRRHMDVIAESIRDDLRLFADAIGLQSERLNRHDARIERLEQRSFQS